jgi:hypothetical protein
MSTVTQLPPLPPLRFAAVGITLDAMLVCVLRIHARLTEDDHALSTQVPMVSASLRHGMTIDRSHDVAAFKGCGHGTANGCLLRYLLTYV